MKNVIGITNCLDEHLIRYTVSYACNFSCKNCYQELKRLANKYKVTKELIHSISIKINELIESITDNKEITLYPEGGEISLWNITEDILPYITSKKLTNIKIVTNLSAELDWYISLIEYLQRRNIQLRLLVSLHKDQIDINQFKHKLLELSKYNIKLLKVLIVVDNQNYLEYEPLIKWLIDNRIKFNLNKKNYDEIINQNVIDFINKYMNENEVENFTVTFDDNSIIKCSGEQLRINMYFKPYGFYCDNNKNYEILPDGMLKHFGCPMEKENFNILTDDISNYNTNIIKCLMKNDRPCNISCQNHNLWK